MEMGTALYHSGKKNLTFNILVWETAIQGIIGGLSLIQNVAQQ